MSNGPTVSQIARYDIKQKIFSALVNVESRRILFIIQEESKTATEIYHETHIPFSTIYNKIRVLQDLALVKVVKTDFSPSGKVEKYYKSRISGAKISINKSEPKLILEKNDVSVLGKN